MRFQGIVPACVTPFVDGRASAEAMQANIARWLKTGVHGFLVFGSTGEFMYLDEDERRDALRAARAAIPDTHFLLAGCGAESTRQTLRNLEWAAEDGADAALVVTPVYYTRGDVDAQRRHFLALADRSPIPILLYTVPAFTAYDLPVDLIEELAQHPNIVGIKDSSGDLKRVALQIRTQEEGDFTLFAGSPNLAYPALIMGAAGSITAFANIVPEMFVSLWNAVQEKDLVRAAALQRAITELHGRIGSMGIPAIKAILAHRGYQPGEPRMPLAPLDVPARERAIAAWRQAMGICEWWE
ncbi:MAG TPA: dihydrodipicolinate synthase family protein [Caldilineae bacterium]|nr:dihydrodipicolinate synthase family protein [Caldilineae bacterium]